MLTPRYRVALVREADLEVAAYPQITAPCQAAETFRALVPDADREHLVAVFLDQKNVVIGVNLVSMGALDMSVAHPREIFKAAILSNAAGLILVHNHPSGDPHPSSLDDELTRRISLAGEILGITLLDHVVVGEGRDFSYRENNRPV